MIIPTFISLTDWSASLVIDFPLDNIPILYSEEDWISWGDLLVQENSFEEADAPGTALFTEWNSWADAVFFAMSNN